MPHTVTLKEALARGWAHVTQEAECTTITLDPPLSVQDGELVVSGDEGNAASPISREEAFQKLIGLYKDNPIDLNKIREEQWGL